MPTAIYGDAGQTTLFPQIRRFGGRAADRNPRRAAHGLSLTQILDLLIAGQAGAPEGRANKENYRGHATWELGVPKYECSVEFERSAPGNRHLQGV